MKTRLIYIFTLISFISFGQELTTIKVSVPNKADEVYIVGNQEALGNCQPDKVKMEKVSDYERELFTRQEVSHYLHDRWRDSKF